MRLGLGQTVTRWLRKLADFLPSNITGLQLWLDATDTTTINSKMGADFVAANLESLSSNSVELQPADTDFSAGAWVKFDSLTGVVMGTGGGSGDVCWIIYGNGTTMEMRLSVDGINFITVADTSTTLSINTWYFVVAVHDSVNDLIKVSVNGNSFNTTSAVGGVGGAYTNGFNIGDNGVGAYLNGKADGAFFLDRALPLEDVKAMYNAGSGVSYTGFLNDLNGDTFALGASFDRANGQRLTSASTDFDKDGTSSFSTGCWFNFDSFEAGGSVLITKGVQAGDRGYYMTAEATTNKLQMVGSSDGTAVLSATSLTALSVSTWHFGVIVYDAVTDLGKVSLDGADFVNVSISSLYDSTEDLSYGGLTWAVGNCLDGVMDGAFFFDRAIDLAEVKAMYATGDGVLYSGLTGLNGNTYALGQSLDGAADAFNIDAALTPLAATTTGTWAAWVKPTDATPVSAAEIITFGDTNANNYIQLFNKIDGKVQASAFIGGTGWTLDTDAAALSSGVFTHIALVQDGVSPVLYINGTAVAQTFTYSVDKTIFFNDGLALLDNGRVGCISFNSGGNTLFFDGVIDEVAIWDRDLSAAEVLSIKDKAIADYTAAEQVNLVAHYALNNVEGANQVDSIGAYNGTVIGAPVSSTGQIDDTTVATIETSLVSWWELNQTDGDTMLDSVTASGNDLTNNNDVGSATGLSTLLDTTVASIETSLVSWWEMNEISGIRFDEHASNNLTDNNTVGYALGHIQEPIGETKTVADFTSASSEYLSSETVLGLGSTTTGTISCWVRPTSGTPTSERIITFGDTDADTRIDLLLVSGGEIRLTVENATTNSIILTTNAGYLSANTWVHIAVTQDGVSGEPVIYINGVAVASTDTGTGTGNEWFNDLSGLDNFRIGALQFGGTAVSSFLDGSMSNIAIYNTNKSAAEILALYNLRLFSDYTDLSVAQQTDLVGFWNLDEASGNRADSSGNGYTLTDNSTVGSLDYSAGYVWRWTDKSSNGFNIDQGTVTVQGEYQNPVGEVILDGVDDFYDITSVLTPLASTTTGTIACWIKPTDATPTTNEYMISFGDTSSVSYLGILIEATTGKLRAILNTGANDWDMETDAIAFSDGTWTHIAIVQDGVAPVLYVNGTAVAQSFTVTTDKTKWITDGSGLLDNIRLGCLNRNAGGNVLHFDGSIAEPLMYDTNLSAGQISQIYNYSKNTYS